MENLIFKFHTPCKTNTDHIFIELARILSKKSQNGLYLQSTNFAKDINTKSLNFHAKNPYKFL